MRTRLRSLARRGLLTVVILALVGPTLIGANNAHLSNAAANAEATALGTLLNTGYLQLWNSVQPITADTAIGAQTLCAELRFASPAFGTASGGVITANAITPDSDADANCAPVTWFRALKSDHTTVVMDGSVGVAGADLVVATTTVVIHGVVGVSAFVFTVAKS